MPLDPAMVDTLPTTEHSGIAARVQSPEKLPNAIIATDVRHCFSCSFSGRSFPRYLESPLDEESGSLPARWRCCSNECEGGGGSECSGYKAPSLVM